MELKFLPEGVGGGETSSNCTFMELKLHMGDFTDIFLPTSSNCTFMELKY